MGLDMYAFKTPRAVPATDFEVPEEEVEQIAEWRKHPKLHGWMKALYYERGGKGEHFDCDTLRLDPADIDALEKAVLADQLPETHGFFFGESQPEDKELDIAFIAEARKAFADGYSVFYDSWW
jgi:hypothetical protein